MSLNQCFIESIIIMELSPCGVFPSPFIWIFNCIRYANIDLTLNMSVFQHWLKSTQNSQFIRSHANICAFLVAIIKLNQMKTARRTSINSAIKIICGHLALAKQSQYFVKNKRVKTRRIERIKNKRLLTIFIHMCKQFFQEGEWHQWYVDRKFISTLPGLFALARIEILMRFTFVIMCTIF